VGLHAAAGELAVLLDDDMEPTPAFLSAHVHAHADGTDLAVLGAVPICVDRKSPAVVRYIGTKFNSHLAKLGQPGYRMRLRDFYTGNCSMRRSALSRVGLFDEAFTIYGNEDLELSVRLARAGVRIVYAPDAIAYQRYTKNFAALASDTIAKGNTAVLLASKHPATFGELKLSVYETELPRWRYARTLLLALSDRWTRAPKVIIRLVELLEKAHVPRLDLVYVLALDYLYWLGARSALRDWPAAIEQSSGSGGPGVAAWG
jgi:GT2 family glycosyltransferase